MLMLTQKTSIFVKKCTMDLRKRASLLERVNSQSAVPRVDYSNNRNLHTLPESNRSEHF